MTMDNQDTINKEREIADDKMITAAFDKLMKTYLDSPHRKKVDIITKAFNFARQAHKGVRRLSGEPYIMHPIAVRSSSSVFIFMSLSKAAVIMCRTPA